MNNRIIRRHHAGTIAATLPPSVAFDENGKVVPRVAWYLSPRRRQERGEGAGPAAAV